MTQPTYVTHYEVQPVGLSSASKTTTTFNAATGDVLVLFVFAGDSGSSTKPGAVSNTQGALTWTSRGEYSTPNNGDVPYIRAYTAVLGSAKTGMDVTVAGPLSARWWGIDVIHYTATGGVGTGFVTANNGTGNTGPSASLTTGAADSAIAFGVADWNATSGSRTYRSVNSATPTERYYAYDASNGMCLTATHANAGTAGAKTIGLTAPTLRWGMIGVEVLGTSGTGATATGSLSLSGTAGAQGPAAATGSLTISGTAGARGSASATGSLSLSGSATADAGSSSAASGTGALSLSGTAGASASASAAGSVSLSGQAGTSAPGSATGSLSIAGTAGARGVAGATGALDLSGAAGSSGRASATGSLSLSGTATAGVGATVTVPTVGTITVEGHAPAVQGSTVISGGAPGLITVTGLPPTVTGESSSGTIAGTGSLSLSGTAGGGARGVATGSLSLSGTAGTGGTASAAGSLSLTGLASLDGVFPASGTGALSLSGTAGARGGAGGSGALSLSGTAGASVRATASGLIVLSGSATSSATGATTATGSLVLTGSAGSRASTSATGSITLSGYVVLVKPPDLFNPRGSIRPNLARGTIRINSTGSIHRDYTRARVRT